MEDQLQDIRSRLAGLRGKIGTALALDGGARVAGALLGCVAVSFLLDRVFKLETAARAVLLLSALAGLAWITWRFVFRRLGALPGEDPLAVAVERRFPQLNDRLISALQLAREKDPERYGMSPQLIEDAVKEAVDPVQDVRFGEIIAQARILKIAALGVLAIVLLAAGAAADPESAGIWFQRNVLLRDVRWPQKTYLEVDPERFPNGVAHIVRGEDLVVTARSVGEVHPARVVLVYEDSEGDRGRVTMKADLAALTYRYEFKAIAFPITFHLEGGDEVTRDYRIELLESPEVTELEILVGFPEYAGREPVVVDLSAGDPEMLRGGSVTLRGTSSKPLENVHLVLGEPEEASMAASLTSATTFELTFRPTETVLAGLRLRDTDGLSNPSLAPRFLVRVVEDRAPKVRFTKHGVGAMVVAGAVVPYLARIHDDVRIQKGRIEIKKSSGEREAPEPHVIELPPDGLGEESAEIRGEIELGPLELSPGAFLTLVAYATDNAHPEAHEGKSDPIALKVVTLEELFSDLMRRQQEQRRLFEELIKREKRLRDRFLDVRDNPPASAAELRVRMESQGQDQREIARRVRAIERAFGQVLDEMVNNRIYDTVRIAELRTKVLSSLETLRKRTMTDHARLLDEAARRADELKLQAADGDEIETGYKRVIAAMEAVLARMVKIEGITEIIERVRGIIDWQKKLQKDTERRYLKVMREIFGEEPPKKDDG